MSQEIHVKGIYKKEPNLGLYALALIELARQLQNEEGRPGHQPNQPQHDQRRQPEGGRS